MVSTTNYNVSGLIYSSHGYCYISISYTALRLHNLSLSYCCCACSYSSPSAGFHSATVPTRYIVAHIYRIAWLDGSKSRTVANLPKNLLRYERFHISYLPLVVSKSRTKHNSRSMNYFPCR